MDFNKKDKNTCMKYSLIVITAAFFLLNPCFGQAPKVKMVMNDYTLLLDNGEIVKLLGLQLPKVMDYRKPLSFLQEESLNVLKLLVTDKDIKLEYDDIKIDLFGNKLAYVFIDGIDYFINSNLIRMGFAGVADSYDFKLKDDFSALEVEAIDRKSGLWREIKETKEIAARVNNPPIRNEVSSGNETADTENMENVDMEKMLNASGFNLSKLGLSSRDLKNAIEGMGIDPKDMSLTAENMTKLQQGKGKGKGQGKGQGNLLDMKHMYDMMSGGTSEKSDGLDVVYINPGENIYHRKGCSHIKKGAKSMIKLHAKLSNQPCNVCKPHIKK